MTRISTICVLSSTLAAFALSANTANAVDAASPKFQAPTVRVQTPHVTTGSRTTGGGGGKGATVQMRKAGGATGLTDYSGGKSNGTVGGPVMPGWNIQTNQPPSK